MSKFRKRPVIIEAIQFEGTPESVEEIRKFFPNMTSKTVSDRDGSFCPFLEIFTLEGRVTASSGDWIIQGIKGEFYPCKPDIFAATYEEVKEPEKC